MCNIYIYIMYIIYICVYVSTTRSDATRRDATRRDARGGSRDGAGRDGAGALTTRGEEEGRGVSWSWYARQTLRGPVHSRRKFATNSGCASWCFSMYSSWSVFTIGPWPREMPSCIVVEAIALKSARSSVTISLCVLPSTGAMRLLFPIIRAICTSRDRRACAARRGATSGVVGE